MYYTSYVLRKLVKQALTNCCDYWYALIVSAVIDVKGKLAIIVWKDVVGAEVVAVVYSL